MVRPAEVPYPSHGEGALWLLAGDTLSDAHEVVIGGRRYRLMLIQEEETHEAPPATPGITEPCLGMLTRREREVVALVARGRLNKQIADELGISEWTVSTHVRRVLVKLGVGTRAEMVARCARAITASARLQT